MRQLFNSKILKIWGGTLGLTLSYSGAVLADNWTDTVLTNLSTFGVIMQALSIIIGLSLMLGGFFKLKRYGESRTFMSHQMTLFDPFLMIVGGIVLLTIPTMLATGIFVLWGYSNPLAYNNNFDSYSDYLKVIIVFVRIIGVGAFIRGVVVLAGTGKGGQHGVLGKGLVHIIGGILLINIVGTWELFLNIFGLGWN